MPDLVDKHELWGTFSVWDHLRRGAFLAEVVLYDRLVIPVPPDPGRAEARDDREFARAQWQRWLDEGWDPQRQLRLLEVLRPVAEPIEWDRQHHEEWASQFAAYAASRRTEAADLLGRMMAGWATGQVLLSELPAKAAGAVAVAPFGSLDELVDELGISETDSLPQRMRASSDLPGELVSVIVGREFLVPDDDDWDELDLLREAVEVAASNDFREARRAFHGTMLDFVRDGKTDYDSIKTAVEAMDDQLAQLDKLTRRRKRWKRLDRGFFFSQVALDVALAPVNPASLAHAGLAIGQYTASAKLGDPASPYTNGPAGALLHQAQEKLNRDRTGNPREASAIERLAATVFRRG